MVDLQGTNGRIKKLPIILVTSTFIFIIAIVIYYPSLSNNFVWDDAHYLGYRQIKSLNWDNIWWMLTGTHLNNWHPLTSLSFALDYAWQKEPSPWGFHLTNIIFHGLNCAIFFLTTILLLNINFYGLNQANIYPNDKRNYAIALIAALFFSVHPQHIESVAWISERKDVLSLFFILLTLIFYIFYTAKKNNKPFLWFIASLFGFTLALMSKPIAVTLPIVLLILDVYPLRRTALSGRDKNITSWKEIFIEKTPFLILTALAISLTLFAQKDAIKSLETIDLSTRILNAINSVFLYISKFLLPISLSPYYIFPSYIINDWTRVLILISGFFLITTLSIIYWHREKRHLLIAWLFYLITLLPVIGIIQVGSQSAADRYAYLPTIPFYILVAAFVVYSYQFFYKKSLKLANMALATITITIFAFLFYLSQNQLNVWKNNHTLWSYVTKLTPGSSLGQYNLSMDYFIKQDHKNTLKHIELAYLHGYPITTKEHLIIAEALTHLDHFKRAREFYEQALNSNKVNENLSDCIYYNMMWISSKQGHFNEALKIHEQVSTTNKDRGMVKKLTSKIRTLMEEETANNKKFTMTHKKSTKESSHSKQEGFTKEQLINCSVLFMAQPRKLSHE